MKKLLARIGSFSGYTFLIALGAFYFISLLAIIILAIYAFRGGA
ncbi:hypothetical protein [Paenibacillus sp. QZ-Y1]